MRRLAISAESRQFVRIITADLRGSSNSPQQFRQRLSRPFQPGNLDPLALHAPEEGLLALGEGADGAGQLLGHIIAVQPPLEVPGDKAVLQAKEFEALPGDSRRVQPGHLLEQPLRQAFAQSSGDTVAQTGTFPAQAEYPGLKPRQGGEPGGKGEFASGDLNRPQQPLPVAKVGGVVLLRAQLPQPCRELGVTGAGKRGAQGGILRNLDQAITAQHGIEVKPATAAEDGEPAAASDVGDGLEAVLLKAKETVSLAGVCDVDQVVGGGAVFRQVLAGPKVHPAIDLA